MGENVNLDKMIIEIPKVDQSRWKLYYIFEKAAYNGSDDEIEEILNQFTPHEFLAIPIVFDLIAYDKISILQSLHQKHIPLRYQNKDGVTALHVACGASGNLKCVKFFIENNIFTDINKKSAPYNDTPLTLAISYEHHDIISYFQKRFNIDNVKMEDIDTIIYTVKHIQKKADMNEIYHNSNAKKLCRDVM